MNNAAWDAGAPPAEILMGSGLILPQEPTIEHPITQDTIVCSVGLHILGIKRKLPKGTTQVTSEADKEMMEHRKFLIDPDCKEYKAMQRVQSDVRTYFREHELPCSFMRRGMHLVSIEMVMEVERQMGTFRTRMAEALEAFCQIYYVEVRKAEQRLRGSFDMSEYPPVEDVIRKCRIMRRYERVGLAPTPLARVSGALMEEEIQRVREECEQMVVEIRAGLRERLLIAVQHMTKVLASGPDGRRQQFKDTSVDKVLEFFTLFERMNATHDEEASALVRQARELVAGVASAGQFRRDLPLRQAVQEGMSQMVTQFAQLVQACPNRQLGNIWEDDEEA